MKVLLCECIFALVIGDQKYCKFDLFFKFGELNTMAGRYGMLAKKRLHGICKRSVGT